MNLKRIIALGVLVTTCCGLTTVSASSADIKREVNTYPPVTTIEQSRLDKLNPNEVMDNINKKIKDGELVTEYQYSELDLAEKLSRKTDIMLISEGYSKEDVNRIRDYKKTFDLHIKQISNLSEEELKNLNYSDDQIDAIINYDGSEEKMSRAAATCNVYVDIDRCRYDILTRRTIARVETSFKWTGCPAIKMRDALVTGYNDWYLEGKTANIKYTYITNNAKYKWIAPDFITGVNGGVNMGAGYSFKSSIEDNYYWASEGFEIFSVSSASRKDMSATGKYADRSVQATPSISFSGGGVSVDFSVTKTTKYYTSYDQMKVQ